MEIRNVTDRRLPAKLKLKTKNHLVDKNCISFQNQYTTIKDNKWQCKTSTKSLCQHTHTKIKTYMGHCSLALTNSNLVARHVTAKLTRVHQKQTLLFMRSFQTSTKFQDCKIMGSELIDIYNENKQMSLCCNYSVVKSHIRTVKLTSEQMTSLPLKVCLVYNTQEE